MEAFVAAPDLADAVVPALQYAAHNHRARHFDAPGIVAWPAKRIRPVGRLVLRAAVGSEGIAILSVLLGAHELIAVLAALRVAVGEVGLVDRAGASAADAELGAQVDGHRHGEQQLCHGQLARERGQ